MRKMNSYAADMIPIRLIISVVVIAAISLMVAFGYNMLSVNLSDGSISNQVSELESELYSMIKGGVTRDIYEVNTANGTSRTFSFNLPSNLNYIAFGVDPDPDNNGVLTTGLTEDGCCIFYKIEDNVKKVIWFDGEYRFREGKYDGSKWVINSDDQGFIIDDPGGSSVLTFELVERSNIDYILVQATDDIDI